VIDRLATEILAFQNLPATQAKYRELGATPVAIGPAEFAAYVDAETAKWKKVIDTAKITADLP